MAENSDDTRKRKRWLLVSQPQAADKEKDFDPEKFKKLSDDIFAINKDGKKPTFINPQPRASTKTDSNTQEKETKPAEKKKGFWRR